ncbi:MAG: flavodoxin [Bacillota bacterium]|jgi:flavodoxin
MAEQLRIVVIYYSLEGNTRLAAQIIAAQTGADLLELKPQKELGTHGFLKYFWGGKQAMLKEKPALAPLERNPGEYDLIFLGTPVWAFTYAPSVHTFLTEYSLRNKRIALFCCDEGCRGKTFANLRAALPENKILGELELVSPLRKDRDQIEKQVKTWVKQILADRTGQG